MQVIVAPHFSREAKRLLKKYPSLAQEIADLIQELAENPVQGTSIGRDCYKIRIAIKSKGKGKSVVAESLLVLKSPPKLSP
ncbi:MAG: hypothetical protein U0Y10_23695 [Spirosomataceae bacterium]